MKTLFTILLTIFPIEGVKIDVPPDPAAASCDSNYGCTDCRYAWGIWTCWGCSGCADALSCEGDVFSCGAGSCFTGRDECVITSSSDSCCGSGPIS